VKKNNKKKLFYYWFFQKKYMAFAINELKFENS